MAVPSAPVASSTFVQTANLQNYISTALVATATGYKFQRSTDGVTYAPVGTTQTLPQYLDTAVTAGTQYWYQVAATNGSGDSAYTAAGSVVPVPHGEMSLGQIRLNAQQRADQVNSQFLTTSEWNANINNSLFELYDLLVTSYGEEYFTATPVIFNTNGSTQIYPLPDGVTTFTNALTNATGYVAPPFYKLMGVDLGPNMGPNGWVSIKRFNFIDRNMYFYPNTNSTLYGVFNMSYRLMGNGIEFIPLPSGGQPCRLWYIPRMTMLLADTDYTSQGVSGWIEYVIVDAAIKAMQKEESDCSLLMAQKTELKRRIEAAAMNRDVGQADTISDTRSTTMGGGPFGFTGGYRGGF